MIKTDCLSPNGWRFSEAEALDAHDAEALAGGRFHHHPTLEPVHDCCAELLEARDFGGDIVGFDVDVDAALVLHALNLHDGFVGRSLQHAVIAAAARMGE